MHRDHRGFSLIEIIVALALAGIVVALAGALLVTSLSAWNRGRDLREAQIQAVGLTDLMAKDIRNGTKAVMADPSGLVAREGEPFLLIAAQAGSPGYGSVWILYLFFPEHGQVLRQVLSAVPGVTTETRDSRVVGRGIVQVSADQLDSSVAVRVEARRGRATAQSRATATPRNP